MTTAEERRLAALRAWAAQARDEGLAVPGDAALAAVAAAGSADGQQDPLVAAWDATIGHLLHQARFGVRDPHLQLPDELRRPKEAPQIDPRETLLDHLLADPAVAAPDLRPVLLKLIVRNDLRTAEQIRSFLPVGPDRQAQAIADSIADHLGYDRQRPPEPEPERAADPSPRRWEPDAAPAVDRPASPEGRHRRGTVPAPPTAPAPGATSAADLRRESAQPPADGPGDVPADGFAPYEYGAGGEPPHDLALAVEAGGTVSAAWPEGPAGAVYRVVADDGVPYSPDDSRLVAATTATRAADTEPLRRAVRHYQVWRNDGPTVEAAKRAQPVLHAEGVLIAPVDGVRLRWEPPTGTAQGRLVGQWRTLPGSAAVHVHRVPRAVAAQSAGDPRWRLDPADAHLNGFVDGGAEPGERYVYLLLVEADVEGAARLSRPHRELFDVPAVHRAVTDLTVTRTATGAVDLLWSAPPGGRVVIYRTQQEPTAGIGLSARSEAVLAEQGALAESDRLAHPVEARPDRTEAMSGVSWPDGWARGYFTPVVLLDGQALVGPSRGFAAVPPVTRPLLVERVQRQLLLFDWPEGADSVEVYRSETGALAADALHGTPVEIGRDEYRERGGFELRGLPARGCDLHLVSVLYQAGRVQSEPVRVHYDGILRLRYRCTVKRPLFGQKGVFVSIGAEFPPDRPPPFVLVHHPDRLPLSKFDGTGVPMLHDGDDGASPTVQFRPKSLGRPEDAEQVWRTDDAAWKRIAAAGGWVRLFVEVPPEKARLVALLDPPAATLRVDPKGGRDA